MPMWSVTEERVIELQRQMKEKKRAYDELLETPIATIWNRDLDHFLEVLEEYEKKEEEDRLAHGNVHNDGKKRRAKKATDGGKAKNTNAKKPTTASSKPAKEQKQSQQAKLTGFGHAKNTQQKIVTNKKQDEDFDVPLAERLKRK